MEPGTEQVSKVALENGYKQNTGSPGILEKPTAIGVTSKVGIARSLVVPRVGQVLVRIANVSGYWQMQVKEKDRPKTKSAFSSHRDRGFSFERNCVLRRWERETLK